MAWHKEFKIACFPYGPFVALPLLTSTIAWIVSMVGLKSCEGFKMCLTDVVSEVNGESPCMSFGYKEYSMDSLEAPSGNAGYSDEYDDYYYYDTAYESAYTPSGSCVDIPGPWRDGALKGGHAFGVLAAVFGSFAWISIITALFLAAPKNAFLSVACLCFANAAFVALQGTLAFASDNCSEWFRMKTECKPSVGAGLAYAAFVLWIVAGVALLNIKKFERDIPERHQRKGGGSHTYEPETTHTSNYNDPPRSLSLPSPPPSKLVEKEKVKNPDGSITITITTTEVDADGSKSITKEIETERPSAAKKNKKSKHEPEPVDEDEDEFSDSEFEDDETVVETDLKTKTKEDGTVINTEIQTFTHRDGRTSSTKTITMSKELPDGNIKRKVTVVTVDKDGVKTKTSNQDVISA